MMAIVFCKIQQKYNTMDTKEKWNRIYCFYNSSFSYQNAERSEIIELLTKSSNHEFRIFTNSSWNLGFV